MNAVFNFSLFFAMVIGGVMLEGMMSKLHYLLIKKHYKSHHFTFGKYLFLLSFPLLATFILTYKVGLSILQIFIIFSLLGTFLEWFIGYSYYKIVGQRLWTYHRYAISQYTSFLSIPLWGLAGVFFWLLAKIF